MTNLKLRSTVHHMQRRNSKINSFPLATRNWLKTWQQKLFFQEESIGNAHISRAIYWEKVAPSTQVSSFHW
jgi:hypothetical protein